ncbi:hypothetical protein ACFV2V_31030 [Streptomyces sp. NPDC059698]|uniref:hypothetical protein n=1 Tax=unclassified Streptomyces TaxID=2593676 RepID=UPI0011612B16|nr:hypothetical protein [Streptomyces sp. CB02366]
MLKHKLRACGILGSLLALSLVAGCSEAGGKADDAAGGEGQLNVKYPEPSQTPKIDSATIPALPIEGYLVSQREKDQILRASRVLAKDCMARFGFDYSWSASSGQRSAPEDNAANRSRRYGIVDRAIASQYGYGTGAPMVEDATGQPPSAQMSDAATRVFLGDSDPTRKVERGAEVNGVEIPEGGCSGESKRKIGNGLSNRPANDINMASFQVSLNDEKVKAAIAKWSACMKKSGYDFDSPLDPLETMGGDEPTPEEKTVAAADITCKYDTNLIGIWSAVEAVIQETMIGKKEEILTEGRTETDRSLKNASDVLSGKNS